MATTGSQNKLVVPEHFQTRVDALLNSPSKSRLTVVATPIGSCIGRRRFPHPDSYGYIFLERSNGTKGESPAVGFYRLWFDNDWLLKGYVSTIINEGGISNRGGVAATIPVDSDPRTDTVKWLLHDIDDGFDGKDPGRDVFVGPPEGIPDHHLHLLAHERAGLRLAAETTRSLGPVTRQALQALPAIPSACNHW